VTIQDIPPRRREVLRLLCMGLRAGEIQQRLRVCKATYDKHRKLLMESTGARNSVQLGMWAQRQGGI
jgi:DNA-binding NarL/FixJ family response regulator